MAWPDVLNAVEAAAKGSWLWGHLPTVSWPAAREDQLVEEACGKLLKAWREGTPAGVALSQPWKEFFGEFRQPDHPAQRVPANLARYAGNYINVVVAVALALAFISTPWLLGGLAIAQVVALLAPPDLFDVELRQFRKGGGYTSIGGAWIRMTLATGSHAGLLATLVFLPAGRLGVLLGLVMVAAHALFRTRPIIEVAKERVGLKKQS